MADYDVEENGLRYRLATQADAEQITAFILGNFVFTEPTSRALGLGMEPESASVLFASMVDHCLSQPADIVSFVVHDAGSGELVAVRMSSLMDLAQRPLDSHTPEHVWQTSEATRLIGTYLLKLYAGVMQLIPRTCDKAVKFEVLNVRKDYMRRGIAQRLLHMSFRRAGELGAKGVLVTATALASQRLFEKLRFDPLVIVHHKYYVDEGGARLLNCDDGTDRGVTFFKDIQ